jgi:hypothetical protein
MYHRNKRATNSVHMIMMRYSNMRGNSKAKLPYIGNGFVTAVILLSQKHHVYLLETFFVLIEYVV